MYIIILSLFSIVSCNWNALGPSFLQSSDSVVSQPFAVQIRFSSQSYLFAWGICTPCNMVCWSHPNPHPKRHLDRFSRFCRAQDCDRPTDKQTDHEIPSVTIGRICIVVRCGLIIMCELATGGILISDILWMKFIQLSRLSQDRNIEKHVSRQSRDKTRVSRFHQ